MKNVYRFTLNYIFICFFVLFKKKTLGSVNKSKNYSDIPHSDDDGA